MCRNVPDVVNEPYKRLRTPEDDANVDVDDLLTRLEYAAGNFKPGYGDYEAVHDAIREIKKLRDILYQKHDSNHTDSRDPEDDIVSRLRDMAYVIDIAQGKAELVMTSGAMLNEAADEIETLRAIADKNRSWLSEEDYEVLLHSAEQMQLAHMILSSDAMIWLLDGDSSDNNRREIISRLTKKYWSKYGNIYRPKK